MKFSTRAAIAILAGTFLLVSCSSPVTAVNVTAEGIAIKGYDPVAYFTQGKPVQGKKAFSHQWDGATWLFTNNMHLDLFKIDPARYAPQFGGY